MRKLYLLEQWNEGVRDLELWTALTKLLIYLGMDDLYDVISYQIKKTGSFTTENLSIHKLTIKKQTYDRTN